MSAVHIILFSKAPLPGQVKTRLVPALGEAGAARLARRMLQHAAAQAAAAQPAVLELCVSPAPDDPAWRGISLPADIVWSSQSDGDLGERMASAARRALAAGRPVLLLGSDCPALVTERIRNAAILLQDCDAVLNPACDGGYVLLGLQRYDNAVFENIPWSTGLVSRITRQRMQYLGWRCGMLPELTDVDEPADLVHVPDSWLEN